MLICADVDDVGGVDDGGGGGGVDDGGNGFAALIHFHNGQLTPTHRQIDPPYRSCFEIQILVTEGPEAVHRPHSLNFFAFHLTRDGISWIRINVSGTEPRHTTDTVINKLPRRDAIKTKIARDVARSEDSASLDSRQFNLPKEGQEIRFPAVETLITNETLYKCRPVLQWKLLPHWYQWTKLERVTEGHRRPWKKQKQMCHADDGQRRQCMHTHMFSVQGHSSPIPHQ
uniref:Uncharacterized protein n=1 Tax=Setaria digitata TaxID=48799 RepID=A0A915PNN2_9BILA